MKFLRVIPFVIILQNALALHQRDAGRIMRVSKPADADSSEYDDDVSTDGGVVISKAGEVTRAKNGPFGASLMGGKSHSHRRRKETTPTAAPDAGVTPAAKYLAAAGDTSCGASSPVEKEQCQAAADEALKKLGKPTGKTMVEVHWSGACSTDAATKGSDSVPKGCSVNAGSGWAPTWNSGDSSCNPWNDYQMVCEGYPHQAPGAQTCPWKPLNNDGNVSHAVEAISACDCSEKCVHLGIHDCKGWTYTTKADMITDGKNCKILTSWGFDMFDCDDQCWSSEQPMDGCHDHVGGFTGAELTGMPVEAFSECGCKELCDAQNDCAAWTFATGEGNVHNGNSCTLRSAPGSDMHAGGYFSGVKDAHANVLVHHKGRRRRHKVTGSTTGD